MSKGSHALGLDPENYYSYKLVQIFESIVMGKDGKHDYYIGIDISDQILGNNVKSDLYSTDF
jgi:hypothetical protein